MPRLIILDAPGVLHHVMIRGIERRKIFLSDIDRHDFISRLSALAQDGAMEIYAWVLMPNHHLLCKTKNLSLASSMRRILTGGDGDFVKQAISGLDDLVKKNLRLSGQRIDVKALAEKVSARFNVSIGELRSGGRRRAVVKARRALS